MRTSRRGTAATYCENSFEQAGAVRPFQLVRSKTVKQYIVDAYTGKPFSGNPAAVRVMDHWPSEESMMNLAMENHRITIRGDAALVAVTELVAEL